LRHPERSVADAELRDDVVLLADTVETVAPNAAS